KLSATRWEDAWEERFHGNPNVVLTRLKNGKSLRVDVYCAEKAEAEGIADQFGGSVKHLADRNWVALSQEVGPPIKIRDSLLITQERGAGGIGRLRREYPGRRVVSIPPEMAFGTGDHPTTATCLRFVADEAKARHGERWRMLDLGCGSGVLAISANLLGAEECKALDYDPSAVAVAGRNAERNGARGVLVEEADLLEWTPRRHYELVAANLFADVLRKIFPKIRRTLRAGSHLIVSGILKDQWGETEAAAAGAGLEMIEVREKGKWVSALGRVRGGRGA
ncbi:MAG: methyltransferase domain-containing protein, partial [Akkermansiaceae bacterium]|nr:methyltransferase domain-containing protein [Akkermansiaceae bacterium]